MPGKFHTSSLIRKNTYNSNTFAIKCTEPEAGHVNVGRLIFKPSLAALVGGRTYTKEGVEIEKHQPVTN